MHINLEKLSQIWILFHRKQKSVRAHEVHGECGLAHAVPGGVYVILPEDVALLPVDLLASAALALLPTALPGAAIAVILPVHQRVTRETDGEPCNTSSSDHDHHSRQGAPPRPGPVTRAGA